MNKEFELEMVSFKRAETGVCFKMLHKLLVHPEVFKGLENNTKLHYIQKSIDFCITSALYVMK